MVLRLNRSGAMLYGMRSFDNFTFLRLTSDKGLAGNLGDTAVKARSPFCALFPLD